MATDTISLDYEGLQEVERQFDELSGNAQRVFNSLNSQLQVLKGGAWVADAATKHYGKMDDEIMPGMQRLIQAFQRSSEICNKVAQLMEAAEEEAGSFLPNDA